MNPFKNKKERNLLKSIVCLVFSLLFFAFAFCPVAEYDANSILGSSLPYIINEKVHITSMDYINVMGVVSRQYEDNDKNLEEINKNLNSLKTEISKSMNEDKDNAKGDMVLSNKTKKLIHEYVVEYYKRYCSESTTSQYTLARVAISGALSLVWVFLGAALIIVSTISVARNALDIQGKNVSKLKATHEEYALPVFLFVTLATLFVMPLTSFSVLNAATIACLTFESLAFAFVGIYAIAEEKSETGTYKYLWIKLVSFVLAVVAVGCCFAPSFKSTAKMNVTIDKLYQFYELESDISLLGVGNISWASYNLRCAGATLNPNRIFELTVKDELLALGNAILLVRTLGTDVQSEIIEAGLSSPLGDSLLAMKTKEESCALSAGYFLALFTVLMLGIASCLTLCPNNKAISISTLVLTALSVLLLIGTLVCADNMVNTVNEFMFNHDIQNYEIALDGGIISAFVFAVCAMIINILIVAGIGVNKKKSVETEEDVIEVNIENIVGSGTEKEDIFEM